MQIVRNFSSIKVGTLIVESSWARRKTAPQPEVWCDPCRGVRGTGELCLERGLWDTGRPPRVSSLARARGALPGWSTLSSASRGIIEKESEISSERADAENSGGPLCEVTRESERTERELGARGPRREATPGLVEDKGAVAEGDSSKLTTGGTSAAILGTGETDTSINSSERAVEGNGDSAVEGECSNLADKSALDVPKKEGQACEIAVLPTTEQKKRKPENGAQNPNTSNGDAKKLRTSTDEDKGPVWQKCKSKEADSADITGADDSVTGEVYENGTGVSGREAEGKEETCGSMRLAVVLVGFPEAKMTEEQAEAVETALVQSIEPSERGEPVQFSATQYENGSVVFTCVNKATKSWLYKTVHKIVPWPGARLAVGRAETTSKGAKFVLWVMMGMNRKSDQQILDFFQKQNKDISTAEWKVTSRVTETERKARLTLWVDDKSYAGLKARNFRLFLGLGKVKFKSIAEWKEEKSDLKKRRDRPLVTQNLPRRLVNYTRHKPVSPHLPSYNFSQPLVPRLGYRSGPRPQISEPPVANTRRRVSVFECRDQPLHGELEFCSTDHSHFREAQITVSDRLSRRERTYTESTVLQDRAATFLASEQLRERRFVVSYRLQSQEASSVISDRVQCRESRYSSDRPRENEYSSSGRWQPLETSYGAPDPPHLGEMSPRETSDWTLSRDSTYVTPKRNKSENLTLGGSDRPLSREPVVVVLDESLTKTTLLQNLASTLLASEEPRECEFDTSEHSQVREASSVVSDRAQRREHRYDSDPPHENKYFTSDRQQPLKTGYRSPDPSQSNEMSYTASVRAQSHDSKRVTSDRSRAENPRLGGSDQPPSCDPVVVVLDESLTKTALLQNLASTLLASEEPRECEFDTSELSQLREVSPAVWDRAQHTEHRYTSDRLQKNEYFTSDRQQPRETGYRVSDSTWLRETRYAASDCVQSLNSECLTPNLDNCRDSRYMAPNRDQSKNPRFRDSHEPPSRVSRFRDPDDIPFQESTLRGSGQMQFREGRFVERDSLYSRESRSRLSDPQHLREYDDRDLRESRSREGRFSGLDFTPHQSVSSYRSLTHAPFSRSVDSSKSKW